MRCLLAFLIAWLCATPALAYDIRPFQAESWTKIRERSNEQIVVVHFWSLTCAPCLIELPEWTKLATDHPKIVFIMVATDQISEAPRLSETLAKAGLATMESWAFADPFVEKLRFAVDPNWRGDLPRTILLRPSSAPMHVRGPNMTAIITELRRE